MTHADIAEHASVLLVRNVQGVLGGRELVDWASAALAAGFESVALVRLAGLDLDGGVPRLADAMPVFEQAALELGIPVTHDPDALLRRHLRHLALAMVRRELDLAEGVARIEREVLAPLNHPPDLMAWCSLDSQMHPETFRELSGDEWTAAVLARAEAELAVGQPPGGIER